MVDQTQLMASFAPRVEAHGGWLALKHDVTAIERTGGGFDAAR